MVVNVDGLIVRAIYCLSGTRIILKQMLLLKVLKCDQIELSKSYRLTEMRIVMADSDLFQVFNANLVSVYIQSHVSEIGIGWKHL